MINVINDQIQNKDYILSYHPNVHYVSLAIHGYTPSYEFHALSEHLLETLIYYKAKKALVDLREMKLIAMEDQRWLVENWLPRAIRIGHDACAVINSNHFFNRVALNNIANNTKAIDFNLQLFDDMGDAVEWLKKSA